ncbi:NT-3 growth factor receptor-like, partial [Cetorhinus maximus]
MAPKKQTPGDSTRPGGGARSQETMPSPRKLTPGDITRPEEIIPDPRKLTPGDITRLEETVPDPRKLTPGDITRPEGIVADPWGQYQAPRRKLNLSSNALVTLSWRSFTSLHLTELVLTGNIFRCSCEILWLQIWQESGRTALGNQSLSCWQNSTAIPLESMQVPDCDFADPTIDLENTTVKEGENLTVRCNASGVPQPSVRWLLDGLKSNYSVQVNPEETVLTLIHIVPEENSNNLTCVAENLVGHVEVSVTLSVL